MISQITFEVSMSAYKVFFSINPCLDMPAYANVCYLFTLSDMGFHVVRSPYFQSIMVFSRVCF
jgi:hypothetical protein